MTALRLALALLVSGCVSSQFQATVTEDADGCIASIRGAEFAQAQAATSGCLRWVGERCSVSVGDDCADTPIPRQGPR